MSVLNWLQQVLVASILFVCVSGEGPSPVTTIEGKLQFPDKSPFNITSRVTLNNEEYTTFSRQDGSFQIFHVPPGVHQLEVHNPTFHFPHIRVLLTEDSMDAPKCLEYAYPGAKKESVEYPLVLTVAATYQYFEARKGFSIFGILKNPMLLMMLFSVGMMFLMPKMMENLEPEEKERMQRQMEMQSDPSKMLSQLWGDLSGTSEPPASSKKGSKKKQN